MEKQKYIKIIKYLAKGDNWRFGMDVTTEIPDIDNWEKKLYVQTAIDDADPLQTVTITGTEKVYEGQLTKVQSDALDRGVYFIKIVARKPDEELRTLTDPLSRLHIF